MKSKNTLLFFILVIITLISARKVAVAQISAFDEERMGCLYFGVGSAVVNTYSKSTIHIDQSQIGNNYQLSSLAASTTGSGSSFSPLQLYYRLGYFFNYNQTWGIELSYDGAPYYVNDNQKTTMSGIYGGAKVNNEVMFSAATGSKYSLNGADLILFNAVKRFGLFWGKTHKVRVDAFLKAGIGPAMPKATVNLYGDPNTPKAQFAGFNTGVEGAIRATLFRYLYLDLAAKYDYASLSGMTIMDGTAKQSFTKTSVVATVGFTIPTTKNHPLFQKGVKTHRVITLKPMYPSSAQ
jgi:hypothetical protein